MSSRRTLILIAAIAIGALAAFAIFNYVGGIEDRANENARRVPVIRIAQDVPRGLTGQEARDQGYLELDAAIAQEYLPRTAITDVETILGKVAVADLPANSVLVENMFVDPINGQVTAADRIPTDHVAVTISVDNVRGVAGLIVPGDYVNMMVVQASEACEGTEPGAEGVPVEDVDAGDTDVLCNEARMVYQGVRVLFVDRSAILLPGEQTTATNPDGTPATPAPSNTGLLTVSVPVQAAQFIASVPSDNWYLTLLPTDYTPAPVAPLDLAISTLPGEDANQLTPYGPQGFEPTDTP